MVEPVFYTNLKPVFTVYPSFATVVPASVTNNMGPIIIVPVLI